MALRILVVDDDPSIRSSISLVLSETGYCVRSAEDGASALCQMREDLPDVLLTDLYMPGMSGFELLAAVRRQYPAIPLIAMSGSFLGNEVPEGVAADAFYPKGSRISNLLETFKMLSPVENRDPHRFEWQPSADLSQPFLAGCEKTA